MNTPELVETLHKKEIMDLNSMLAMLRAQSRENLKVWATVKPIGYHFKGYYMQPATSSLLGAASCDLRTAWKRQDALYAKYIPTFNETLQSESFSTGAFDKYNKLLPTKNQVDGKA